MAYDTEIMKELAELKAEIQILSDKEAIRDLLSRYGLDFDLGRYENFYDLWTDDAVFRTDGPDGEIKMVGKDQMKKLFGIEQTRYTASQHLQLEYIIKVNGDTAEAIGYQLITVHTKDLPSVDRTGVRLFKFQKVNGNWLIKEAVSRVMKNQEGCLDLVPIDW